MILHGPPRPDNMERHRDETDLSPVQRKCVSFDLESAKNVVKGLIGDFMALPPNVREFPDSIRKGGGKPELMCDGDALLRVPTHPMDQRRTKAPRKPAPRKPGPPAPDSLETALGNEKCVAACHFRSVFRVFMQQLRILKGNSYYESRRPDC